MKHHTSAQYVEMYITLGDIIDRLEQEDPNRVLPLGFANPHSFRGYYNELAFEPIANIRIGDMLEAARAAIGPVFEGWKGGDYTYDRSTSCWIAYEGSSSDVKINSILLDLLLKGRI